MDEKERREKMFEAEMINQQLERLQDYMGTLDKQAAEVRQLKLALDQWSAAKEGEEMLVPVAAGIFAKAISTNDKTLHVNVGNNIVIPKTSGQVQTMMDEQLSEMKEYQDQIHKQYNELLKRLQQLEKEFEA